jgi:hypothetical protein
VRRLRPYALLGLIALALVALRALGATRVGFRGPDERGARSAGSLDTWPTVPRAPSA